jgi:predicted lipoprotein
MKKIILSGIVIAALATACKKDKTDNPANPSSPATEDMKQTILSDFSGTVCQATYNDLSANANNLYNAINTFVNSNNDNDLVACKQAWRQTRQAWEQSEGFLFGPVESDNIDPHIDTWPVNFASLDSILANGPATFDGTYIDNLEDALKGFHPIEYLLFGNDGAKTAAQFNQRQKDFLVALTLNLKALCTDVSTKWNPAVSGNYHAIFTTAGNGSAVYSTKRAAYEELVNAMAGICDEVANGKMKEPYDAVNASLEESPFAKNSLTDFRNNIKSVENVYLGRYTKTDGTVGDAKGLEDLVRANNLSLDGNFKTKVSNAIAAIDNITVYFGQAIQTSNGQRQQIQIAMQRINELKDLIEGDLLTYIQQQTN